MNSRYFSGREKDEADFMVGRLLLCVLIALLILAIAFTSYAETPSPQSSPTRGEDGRTWTAQDTTLQATFTAITVADWCQTLQFARNTEMQKNFEETNPFLGPHPSERRVNTVIAASIVTHAAIAYALPKPYRTIWQSFWIGVEAGAVRHNSQIGLGINLHF